MYKLTMLITLQRFLVILLVITGCITFHYTLHQLTQQNIIILQQKKEIQSLKEAGHLEPYRLKADACDVTLRTCTENFVGLWKMYDDVHFKLALYELEGCETHSQVQSIDQAEWDTMMRP
jgi:hypothetical protein